VDCGSGLLDLLKLYLVIPLSQVLIIELQINLRRVKVAVAQQLLHTPQVKTGPDEVDGKRMPERMGMNVNANHLPIFLHYSVHLTPFNAKDVLVLRDILRRNVFGKQFKGFIIQYYSFSFALSQ